MSAAIAVDYDTGRALGPASRDLEIRAIRAQRLCAVVDGRPVYRGAVFARRGSSGQWEYVDPARVEFYRTGRGELVVEVNVVQS